MTRFLSVPWGTRVFAIAGFATRTACMQRRFDGTSGEIKRVWSLYAPDDPIDR